MLTGELVRLRKFEPDDLDRIVGWINDVEVTQYLAARYPYSRAQEQGWLERVSTMPISEGIVMAIDTLAESRHIGTVNLHDIAWEDRHATLGVMIGDKEYWGRGFGTDAIVTLLHYAFDWMNLHRVDLRVWAGNPRGIASYRKCGFVEEGRLRQDHFQSGALHDLVLMGVLRDEFHALRPSRALEEVQ